MEISTFLILKMREPKKLFKIVHTKNCVVMILRTLNELLYQLQQTISAEYNYITNNRTK